MRRQDEFERTGNRLLARRSGEPSVVIEGEEIPSPAGTYARLGAHVRRTVADNGAEPATVLICSAPRSSGYEPMGWA